MYYWIFGLSLISLGSVSAGVRSSSVKSCADITCALHEYCATETDHQCHKCSLICHSDKRNYDETLCDESCQDYIHDVVRHYITQDELDAKLNKLNSLVGVSLFLGISLSVFAILVIVVVWLKYRQFLNRNRVDTDDYYKKLFNINKFVSGNNSNLHNGNSTIGSLPQITTVTSSLPDSQQHKTMGEQLNKETPSEHHMDRQSSGDVTPSTGETTTTQLSGHMPRYPSEDATLEFAAYDNHAMTPTPPRTTTGRY